MHQDAVEQLDKTIAEVFSLMLNRDCNPTPSCPATRLAENSQLRPYEKPHAGISASISFSGSMRGNCSIHLPLRTAAAITGELVGEPPQEHDGVLNADTAGEICNMIAGSWKSRQPNPHSSCALSTPQIIEADVHVNHAESYVPPDGRPFRNTLVRIYSFEDHCLHLELGFD